MSDWITGILVLLIVVILADGFRRTYSARQNRLGVSPSLNKRHKDSAADDSTENYGSELPNGGARIIGQRDSAHSPSQQDKKLSGKEMRDSRRNSDGRRTPEQARLDLEKSVPILMDSVDAEPLAKNADSRLSADERIEPTFSSSRSSAKNTVQAEPELDYPEEDYQEDYPESEYPEEDEEGFEDEYENEEYEEELEEELEEEEAAAAKTQPEEVFIINVMAFKGEMFNGNDLLDAALKCGLRYGDMDIFHRYSNSKGEGTLLFSMANMVKPGTFDLDAMDDFETPGVSLFMTLPIEADSMKSFELMVETAHTLAEALDGELKDEQRSVMTRQTIEHCRQRISDFERKKLFRRPR
ncbi:MAG TPA: cell division protein ZipA [Cellvibrio sp.]|nr:cell division protein ZipA [Cellvibrio sp.]